MSSIDVKRSEEKGGKCSGNHEGKREMSEQRRMKSGANSSRWHPSLTQGARIKKTKKMYVTRAGDTKRPSKEGM